MRKNILLVFLICLVLSVNGVFASCNPNLNCNCCSCQNSYKYITEQIKKERMAISNALLLSEEQAKYRVELLNKNSIQINEKTKQLYDEKCKLKTMELQKASNKDIQAQKKNIKCIKKQLDNIIQNENKEFKKVLDKEQRAKFSMIQKLERKTLKDCQKSKDYYKSNPKMRPFAP